MKILITGSSGLLGNVLAHELRKVGHEVFGLSRETSSEIIADLQFTTQKKIHEILDSFSPNIIIHCACNLHPKTTEDFLLNSYAIKKFFTYKFAQKIKFIIVGSVSEYGIIDTLVPEVNEDTLIGKQNLYGQSKFFQTTLSAYFREVHNLDISVFRLSNLVSPHLPPSSLIGALLSQISEPTIKTVKIPSLDSTRDFVDIRDVADLFLRVIKNPKKKFIYVVGSGDNTTYSQIIKSFNNLLKKVGRPPVRVNVENKREEFNLQLLNIRSAKEDYDWNPRTSLDNMLKWCLKVRGIYE